MTRLANLALAPLLFAFSAAAAAADDRPNVLLIMTDDQGWGDVRSHGNEQIETPALDRLAAAGARFDRFFVSPVCAPTRASLLTGRYHLRTGVHGVTRGQENMRAEETTVAEAFKAAGYATGAFGKWHNGKHFPNHPNGQGFDEFVGFCGGHWNNYFDTPLERNGVPFKSEGYITDVLTDAAIDFIDENKSRPFFCYVPYNAPHSPWQVPDKYFQKYKSRGLDDTTACAYAMVENIDDNVSRLLAALDQRGIAENTIVLFLTDNGPNSNRYNGDMKGRKGSTDEGGVRVPLFVRWPGKIKAGLTIKPIAMHVDLFPTLVKLCNIKMPKTLPQDGRSLAPLLRGEEVEWKDRALLTFRRTGESGAVRTQQWRAVGQGNNWKLYDMLADPSQSKDVAKQHAEKVAELSRVYKKTLAEIAKGGFQPLPVPVGHAARPLVELPGHEAFLEPSTKKGISYSGPSGWANDWIANWKDIDAFPWWDVDVARGGRYEVSLLYVCRKQDTGVTLAVEVGGGRVEGVVTQAHDPAHLPSPDRVPRKEVYEKEWAELELGAIDISKGRTRLIVKALDIPGEQAIDLKAVRLKRIADSR